MANSIILKKSSVTAKVPLASDLAFGEIALNYADGKIYYKKSDGVTIDSFQSGVSSIPSVAGNSGKFLTNDGTTVSWGSLSSSNITTALGYTPYNSSNPSNYISANQNITISGDATGSGNTAIALTLANSGVTAGTYTKITVDAKGRATAGTSLTASDIPELTLLNLPGAWIKKAVDCATTAALIFNSAQTTIDGVTISASTRVLVKDQTTQSQNGIYTNVNTTTWVRATDSDIIADIAGAAVNVDAGTVNGGRIFTTTLKLTDTLGTTNMLWYQVLDTSMASAASPKMNGTAAVGVSDTYSRGDHIHPTDTSRAPSGGASTIVTLGTVTTGTWNATLISPTYGGTGVNNGTRTLTVNTNSGTLAFTNAATTLTIANTASISGTNTGDQTITLTGDVTGTGTGSFAATLANSGVTAGTYTKVTVDAKGRVTVGASLASADLPTYTGSLTSSQVTTALGFTPYNSTNPSGYITSSGSISGNAATATALQTARNINGTSFNGTADINATEWYHSGRDFVNGTLITTSIDYSQVNGDPFVLQIRGNSYGSVVPFDIQLQGYIYSSTIINYGGYSTGPTFNIIAMNVGGYLCFWFARQAYWQGFNVHAYTAYGPRAVNRVTNITDVANPGGSKQVTFSPYQVLRSDNYTSYSPSLTGAGASGIWGISVTGSAASVANSLTAGTGLSGTAYNGSAAVTWSLATSGVTAGTYSVATITVDAYGRVTSASTGTGGGLTLSDDTTTNATYYPLIGTATSGTASAAKVSSSKLTYNPSTGTLTAIVFSSSSDESLKTNWRALPSDFIQQLATVKHGIYDRIDEQITQEGVSAQSLQGVLKHSVVKDKDGMLSVNYGAAALVSAIELAAKVVEQEKRIAKLEALLEKLIGDNK